MTRYKFGSSTESVTDSWRHYFESHGKQKFYRLFFRQLTFLIESLRKSKIAINVSMTISKNPGWLSSCSLMYFWKMLSLSRNYVKGLLATVKLVLFKLIWTHDSKNWQDFFPRPLPWLGLYIFGATFTILSGALGPPRRTLANAMIDQLELDLLPPTVCSRRFLRT